MPRDTASNNSYLDLTPGARLRILVPILEGSQKQVDLGAAQTEGTGITLTAKNLAGYEFLYYSAEGGTDGRVRLKFASAESSRNGLTVPERKPRALPFTLPTKPQFVRLVFLVRVSESDHNMAIMAAGTRTALDELNAEIRLNSNACQTNATTFCVWVPQNVAVRPETAGEVKNH